MAGIKPILLALFAAASAILAVEPGDPFAVAPGPTKMSDDERAIEAGAFGAEHAVILIEQTERRDTNTTVNLRHHMRAKILSAEGRDLADVEIPFIARKGKLLDWWGRTILPDGGVVEFPRDKVVEQSVVKAEGFEIRAFKAALPGVVPGAVIDYGYEIEDTGPPWFEDIAMQGRDPVREWRLRWKSARGESCGLHIANGEGRDAKTILQDGLLTVTARDLPGVKTEPFMPAKESVFARAVLYRQFLNDPRDYWRQMALGFDAYADWSSTADRALQRAIDAMRIDASRPVPEKLHAAYDWVLANVENTGLRDFDQLDAASGDREAGARRAKKVLETRKGSPIEINVLFLGLARKLGAGALVCLVRDRKNGAWDPAVPNVGQFDSVVLMIHDPDKPKGAVFVLDPGSGLPWGEAPWRYVGTRGFVANAAGGASVVIGGAAYGSAVAESKVTLRIGEEGLEADARWTRRSPGQRDADEKRNLRRMPPEQRPKRLERLCGSGGGVEVRSATSDTLDAKPAGFSLACEATVTRTPSVANDRLQVPFDGPWIDDIPDLPAGPRVHPLVFSAPREDATTLDVAPPEGFVAGEAPAAVRWLSPHGEYNLAITPSDRGFRVERNFTIVRTEIPLADYEAFRAFLARVRASDRTLLPFVRTSP